jgi:hypothetical protein
MKLLAYFIVKLYVGAKLMETLLNAPLLRCLHQLPANILLTPFWGYV